MRKKAACVLALAALAVTLMTTPAGCYDELPAFRWWCKRTRACCSVLNIWVQDSTQQLEWWVYEPLYISETHPGYGRLHRVRYLARAVLVCASSRPYREVGQTDYDLGPISQGNHRLKMASLPDGAPSDGKWHFIVDYVPLSFTLPFWNNFTTGHIYEASERTNSCSGGVQDFINTWRYSATNNDRRSEGPGVHLLQQRPRMPRLDLNGAPLANNRGDAANMEVV